MQSSKHKSYKKIKITLSAILVTFLLVLGGYKLYTAYVPGMSQYVSSFPKYTADLLQCITVYFDGVPPYRITDSGPLFSVSNNESLQETKARVVSGSNVTKAIEDNYYDNFQTCFRAEAAYVVDEQGKVLFAQNEHAKLYPASTTKMMTAYLALMYTEDLDALITVDKLTGCYEGGSILLYLKEGDKISMRDLLYALLMCSYNDSATAIAMEIGGSLEGFAEMMNAQLEEIGAKETNFVTPHGLHDEDHYTTAYDLNLILQMACELDTLREIMMTEEITIEIFRGNETISCDLKNSSYFIKGSYEVSTMEYVGGKTGYTQKAQSCLASVFEYEGVKYYSTIMKAQDASYMTTLLFNYYFAPEDLAAFSVTTPLLRR